MRRFRDPAFGGDRLAPYREVLAGVRRLYRLRAKLVDARSRGTAAQASEHGLDQLGLAAHEPGDRAVRLVANPAGEAELTRLRLRPGPEADALDAAGDVYGDGLAHEHFSPHGWRQRCIGTLGQATFR